MNKEVLTVTEKTMTTKEIAKQLNTSHKVILQNARKCLPNKKIENGKPTYWNEKEVTVLLEFLKKNKAKQPFTDGLRCMTTKLYCSQNEKKVMTVKELADVLGVTARTIQLTIERLGLANVLSQVKIRGQGSYVFTENQATLVKQEIQKHHNLANRNIDNAVTELEKQQTIIKAMQYLQEGYEALVQQNKTLEIELDKSKEYITIKRMEKLNPGYHFNWRLLKAESQKLNKQIKETFDQNYGTVKAYHISVWESLYFDSLNYPE